MSSPKCLFSHVCRLMLVLAKTVAWSTGWNPPRASTCGLGFLWTWWLSSKGESPKKDSKLRIVFRIQPWSMSALLTGQQNHKSLPTFKGEEPQTPPPGGRRTMSDCNTWNGIFMGVPFWENTICHTFLSKIDQLSITLTWVSHVLLLMTLVYKAQTQNCFWLARVFL